MINDVFGAPSVPGGPSLSLENIGFSPLVAEPPATVIDMGGDVVGQVLAAAANGPINNLILNGGGPVDAGLLQGLMPFVAPGGKISATNGLLADPLVLQGLVNQNGKSVIVENDDINGVPTGTTTFAPGVPAFDQPGTMIDTATGGVVPFVPAPVVALPFAGNDFTMQQATQLASIVAKPAESLVDQSRGA